MTERKQFTAFPRRVALFVTCMVDTLYPDVGMASVDLLEQQGIEVVFPFDQTCCGQPAFNAGYRAEARQVARHFLDVFEPLVASGTVDAIVAPSGSCAAMVVHSFPLLFAEVELASDLQRAERIAAVTFELTEFLVDVLGVTSVHASVSGRVAYHACCHALRELGIDEQPRMLLSSVQNEIAVPLNGSDECCGFGGLFAIKNAPISTAMGERKIRNIAESGADLVALCDVSCMTHINGLLSRQGAKCRAVHIAQVLTGEEQSPEKSAPVEEAAPEAPPRRWQDLR